MHTIRFYPVGNADCSQIILENGKRLLFDFCHRKESEEGDDPRIDLKAALTAELESANRNSFDVLALTHLDDDHIANSTEFFFLQHAKKYQSDDRKHIGELWVPAAAILEIGLSGEAAIWRSEARHRLKQGKGIRVFSKPTKLEDWLKGEGLSLEEREHLISDAGELVDGINHEKDGVEFFTHSPFAKQMDGDTVLRNESALILHATFLVSDRETRYLMIGDSTWEILEEIVEITQEKGNEERLKWDVYNIPHHCSYLALGPDKGKDYTKPVSKVQWLLDQCQLGGIIVSSSDPIPTGDTTEPPHYQAAKTYRKTIEDCAGRKFVVTMEHPNTKMPKVMQIDIGSTGAMLKTIASIGTTHLTTNRPPRAGSR